MHQRRVVQAVIFPIIFAALVLAFGSYWFLETPGHASTRLARESSAAANVKIDSPRFMVREAVRMDLSLPFAKVTSHSVLANFDQETGTAQSRSTGAKTTKDLAKIPASSAAVEQRAQGYRAPPQVVESFDGLGVGFEGPQGKANVRNPSDNSLAVGPDHIVQTVNTRVAIYTKKGRRFHQTGKVLYGPVVTKAFFAGFGGQCETRNNGDAVVRYDQLAGRWLIVMQIGRAHV